MVLTDTLAPEREREGGAISSSHGCDRPRCWAAGAPPARPYFNPKMALHL
jgi:hypothetical protein